MKLSEVFGISQVLKNIANESFPIKTAYKFSKILNAIDAETDFYILKIKEIISTYGLTDEQGNYHMSDDNKSVLLDPDKRDEWTAQLNELDNLEIDLNIPLLTIDELGDLNLTIQEVNKLLPILEE